MCARSIALAIDHITQALTNRILRRRWRPWRAGMGRMMLSMCHAVGTRCHISRSRQRHGARPVSRACGLGETRGALRQGRCHYCDATANGSSCRRWYNTCTKPEYLLVFLGSIPSSHQAARGFWEGAVAPRTARYAYHCEHGRRQMMGPLAHQKEGSPHASTRTRL